MKTTMNAKEKAIELMLMVKDETLTASKAAEYFDTTKEEIISFIKELKDDFSNKKLGTVIDGELVLTKRIVLEIAMMMDTSDVAVEVRSLILNGASNDEKAENIMTIEQKMLLDIVYTEGIEDRAVAVGNYAKYKNEQFMVAVKMMEETKEEVDRLYKLINK